MKKILEIKSNLEEIALDLPIKGFSALGHIENIKYCTRKLKSYIGKIEDPVVGYVKASSPMGLREVDHTILPRKKAEKLKNENSKLEFNYYKLNDFLREKKYIKNWKYKLYKGLIIGEVEEDIERKTRKLTKNAY